MRFMVVGLVLTAFAGAASAGDPYAEPMYDSNDYSAKAFYRVEFGGASKSHAQSVGLRFDNERAAAAGAPALFQANFGEQGVQKLALNGLDLHGMALQANATGGFASYFANLSIAQWVVLAFTAGTFLAIGSEAAKSEDEVPAPGSSGTGTGT